MFLTRSIIAIVAGSRSAFGVEVFAGADVLAASIRHLQHLLGSFALRVELVTAPSKVREAWAASSFLLPGADFVYPGTDKADKPLKAIAHKSVDLSRAWDSFDIGHDLTTKGIQQFAADYKSTLRQSG